MIAISQGVLTKALDKAGWKITRAEAFGPSGTLVSLHDVRRDRHGSLIITQAEADGEEWLHTSLAWRDQMPTYEDLRTVHLGVFGRRRWSYEIHAPANEHVNIHEFARHLWGKASGANALPDFTQGAGTV